MAMKALDVATRPTGFKAGLIVFVTGVLKVTAWLVIVGGIIAAVSVARDNSALNTMTATQKDLVAAGIGFGTLLLSMMWAWMAYTLEALAGMWTTVYADSVSHRGGHVAADR